jgi:hypothetical protein
MVSSSPLRHCLGSFSVAFVAAALLRVCGGVQVWCDVLWSWLISTQLGSYTTTWISKHEMIILLQDVSNI